MKRLKLTTHSGASKLPTCQVKYELRVDGVNARVDAEILIATLEVNISFADSFF